MAYSRARVAEEDEVMNPSPVVLTSEPPCDLSVWVGWHSCQRGSSIATSLKRENSMMTVLSASPGSSGGAAVLNRLTR
jgi:hypothetical protein